MELVLNQELDTVPEPVEVAHFTTNGLLNSNYKNLVRQNFSTQTPKSLFGIRQRLKSAQVNIINHTATILRVTVFAIVLIAIF